MGVLLDPVAHPNGLEVGGAHVEGVLPDAAPLEADLVDGDGGVVVSVGEGDEEDSGIELLFLADDFNYLRQQLHKLRLSLLATQVRRAGLTRLSAPQFVHSLCSARVYRVFICYLYEEPFNKIIVNESPVEDWWPYTIKPRDADTISNKNSKTNSNTQYHYSVSLLHIDSLLNCAQQRVGDISNTRLPYLERTTSS